MTASRSPSWNRWRWLLTVAAFQAVACGGGGNGETANRAPLVTSVTATPSPVVQAEQVQLAAQASDADGDRLTYSWTQTAPGTPIGTFGSPSSASTTWTAPGLSAVTQFTLTVTVSDGHQTTSLDKKVYVKVSSEPSFTADVLFGFVGTCDGCHSGTQAPGRLDLTPSNAYSQLVGVPAVGGCTSLNRVEPSDPDHSVLMLKISGSSCGARMPLGNVTYFDQNPAELAVIRSWIEAGAPNN